MKADEKAMPIKVNAYRHQKEAYDFVLKTFRQNGDRGGASLLMEMGTGKTLTAIAVAGAQIIEVGSAGQDTPSSTLATGGIFFKAI